MTAQTHTPDDPPGEKPIERWSRWENSKVPERRCTAHKRNGEQCKTLQYAAATSADITTGTHPPARPKLDYVWRWQRIEMVFRLIIRRSSGRGG